MLEVASLPCFYSTPAVNEVAHVLFQDADLGVGLSIRAQGDVQRDIVFPILEKRKQKLRLIFLTYFRNH